MRGSLSARCSLKITYTVLQAQTPREKRNEVRRHDDGFREVILDKPFERSTHFPQTRVTVNPGAMTARAICNPSYGLPLT